MGRFLVVAGSHPTLPFMAQELLSAGLHAGYAGDGKGTYCHNSFRVMRRRASLNLNLCVKQGIWIR